MSNINHKPLGAILLIIGLGMAAYTLHGARQNGLLSEAVAAGQVADRYTTGRRTDAPEPALRVVYLSEAKEVVELRQEVDEEFWEEHPPGSAVQVHYVPGRADQAMIVGATGARTLMMGKLGGGALLALLGIGVLLYGRARD